MGDRPAPLERPQQERLSINQITMVPSSNLRTRAADNAGRHDKGFFQLHVAAVAHGSHVPVLAVTLAVPSVSPVAEAVTVMVPAPVAWTMA